MHLYILKSLAVDGFESIAWWLANWRVDLCSCPGFQWLVTWSCLQGVTYSFVGMKTTFWQMPTDWFVIYFASVILLLLCYTVCRLHGTKDFCAWKLKAYNRKQRLHMQFLLHWVNFHKTSLTFRVDSTVFNVLVIYLKASLIFILAFNIWHIPITKRFCQKQSKSQLERKRCGVKCLTPYSLFIENLYEWRYLISP